MFLLAPYRALIRHRQVLWTTTLSDLRGTYAGSVLGMAWLFIGPVLLLLVYALVYAVIFRVRPTGMSVTEYILYVFCGLVPFLAFASSLTAGAMSLAGNRQLLLNTVFPAELIPVRSVLVATATMPASVIILLAAEILLGKPSPIFLLVPVVAVLELMFIVGLSWVLSLLTLLLRDIQQVLSYVTMVLLVVTPIAYTPDMVPSQLKLVMYFNPLYYYVVSFQSLVILGALPAPHIVITGTIISVVLFGGGYGICLRARQAFYDFA